MNENMPVLPQNILAGFTPPAQRGFLRALDKTDLRGAERFANEVMRLTDFIDRTLPVCGAAFNTEREVLTDLEEYILERHWNLRFPAKHKA